MREAKEKKREKKNKKNKNIRGAKCQQRSPTALTHHGARVRFRVRDQARSFIASSEHALWPFPALRSSLVNA